MTQPQKTPRKPSYKMKMNKQAEHGNVFLVILLGVALFGALAFVISRGMRSETTTAMSDRQAELIAVDVMSYAQRIERAVNNLRKKPVSENDIDFENAVEAGYNHTPPGDDENKIFGAGGKVTWQKPPEKANDGSPWHFTGRTCVADIGTGTTGCASDNTSNEELLAILPNINVKVCEIIDRKLGMNSIPSDVANSYSSNKFQGTYNDGKEINLNLGEKHTAACYENSGAYHFYYVLLAR